jgi:hypothetical protein
MSEVRWDEAHPRAAPQFRCHICRRWIGKASSLYLLNREDPGPDPVTMHTRCAERRASHPTIRQAHAQLYPDCPEHWHDAWDHHDLTIGTWAGVAAVLGLWPVTRRR